MDADQYDAAVHALAALMETWQANQHTPVHDAAGRQAA